MLDHLCSPEHSHSESFHSSDGFKSPYVLLKKATEYYLIEDAFHISTEPELECLQGREANLGLNVRAPLREKCNR